MPLVAIAAIGPRWPLRTAWLAAGIAAAVTIAAPYVIWQAQHGWPQLTVASNVGGSAEGGRIGFVPFQFLLVSPVLAPVWIAGLLQPWRRPSMRVLRFIPVTYAVMAIIYLLGNGKAYYLASFYPILLGLGAQPTADWTRRARSRLRTTLFSVAAVTSVAVSALIALPLLPETALQGSVVIAINPDQGETVGWPQFIETVAAAWQSIPAAQRAHTVIFTQNYGEAAAVDLLGPRHGLPRAYSGHNGFNEWGQPPADATQVLLLGCRRPRACGTRIYRLHHQSGDQQSSGARQRRAGPARPTVSTQSPLDGTLADAPTLRLTRGRFRCQGSYPSADGRSWDGLAKGSQIIEHGLEHKREAGTLFEVDRRQRFERSLALWG